MSTKIKSLLSSSANPENLSLTIKGILTSFVPIIILLTNLEESTLITFVDAIATAAASIMIVFGLARKIYYKLKK